MEKEIKMKPETEALFRQVFEEVNRKWEHLEKEEARKEGRKEGIKEGIKEGRKQGIKEVAKNLKKVHTDLEISNLTGLSISEVKKL